MVQSTSQPPRSPWSERLRRIVTSVIVTAGLFGLGFLSGGLIARLTLFDSDADVSLPLLLFIAIGGMFSVILTHELGHLVGGRLVGFQIRLLVVGPLKIDRIDQRLRISLNRSHAHAGGVAAACCWAQ